MSNIFKSLALIALAAGGGALVAYAYRDKLKEIINPKGGKKSGKKPADNKQRSKSDNAMTDVCNAFVEYAENFSGLYETMYKASIGTISMERKRNLLTEWDLRMDNLVKAPGCLKGWWASVVIDKDSLTDEELQHCAQQILDMVLACKIVRDQRNELVADADTAQYYLCEDGSSWEVGQKLRVKSPCWYIPCSPPRILEKGYCEIV